MCDCRDAEATLAVGEVSDEPKFLLATQPPTLQQRRLALAVAAVLLAAFGLTAPFAAVPLPRFDAFIPSLAATIFVTDLITAVLLFAQYSIFPSRALLGLACGYLFTALIVIPHVLTYPGVFAPTGLLGAGLQSTGWLYFFWHIGFSAALLVYACLKDVDSAITRGSTHSAIGWSIAIVFSLVWALGWLATGGEWLLPRIFLDVTHATPLNFYIFAANISIAALTFVLLWARRRSVLDLWLMVVILALMSELALVGVIGSTRFAVGFYAGRIFSLVTSTVVLVVLLVETTRLYARLHSSLAESEEQTAIVAASTHTGLWQFQAEDEPIWATRHCRSILGLAEDAPLSFEVLRDSIHPDDRRSFVKAIRSAMSAGRPIDGEFRLASGDEIHWIAVKGRPRRNEDNRNYYINGVLSDVTAVKTAEEEAEAQRREIAHLMRQSVLGELSGAIAHELSQPLTAILANAEAAHDLLGQKLIDLEKIRAIVADIIAEDTRASDVMSRIRKLLRKGESKSEIIDLNQLVSSTVDLLHSELVRRETNIEVVLAEGLPTIFGDPVQLQQVLLNAMMNAMEAMGSNAPGQRVVKVMTRANGNQVQAVIVDSGHGISPEHQTRLFQPFFTTKEHGLGLGLSICSTIVKTHGGKLSIENNTGAGATVTVTLPIQDNAMVPA